MRSRPLPYIAAAVSATFALVGATSAMGAGSGEQAQAQTSANWAGYAVSSGTEERRFTHVAGSWVQPSADCSSGQGTAAFWVGLGGASGQSQGLEQVGTELSCGDGGQAQSSAWYELIPAAPVPLDLTIKPGDHISASVTVNGTAVTVSLSDQTSGKSVTKHVSTNNIDVASAEWIAEAPSACTAEGCTPMPLANFGNVTFTNTSATTADGHTGSISDPSWTAQPLQLGNEGDNSADAVTTTLDNSGSFSVSWSGAQQITDPSTSSGDGYGYGGGGTSDPSAGSGGYSDGSGGYSDGSGGYDPGANGYGGGGYWDGGGSYDGGGYPYGYGSGDGGTVYLYGG